MIEPLQSSFAQRIYEEHVFDVEDRVGSREKFTRSPEEFSHPIPGEPALENERRTIAVVWNRDSQHALVMARE